MSANPTNASLEIPQASTTVEPGPGPVPVPGFEALQALLAFSSLHEQIRQRRTRQLQAGAPDAPESDLALEQFVLDEVLQLVAERALALTGADGIAIAFADGDEIICRASSGEIAPDAGARLDPNSGFSGACLRSGEIIRCDDAENDPRVNVQASRRLGAHSMIAVPLAGQHACIGLIEAFSYDAHAFNDSDVRSLNLLSELILSALRPEEEDRLAQVSKQVVARAAVPQPDEETTVREGSHHDAAETASVEKASQHENAFVEPEPEADSVGESGVPVLASQSESRPGLGVVFAVVLFALAVGAGLWWTIQHKAQSAKTHPAQQISTPAPAPAPPPQPVQAASQPLEEELPVPFEAETTQSDIKKKLAVLPLVTSIRHWSSAGASTVAVDLQDQVQYEAHRLTNPERIYVDLHDTALSSGLLGKTIDVGDELLVRVRIAQPMPGITRVVLETRGGSNFSVSLEPSPYRLVVEVRGVRSDPHPRASINLFAPPPSAAANTAPPLTASDQLLRAQTPKFRIVLDAGHGGWDLGTVGRQGLLEKDLVLDIVSRLGDLVSKRLGSDVIYTRANDDYIPLERRAEIANQAQADLFLSVHANYSVLPSARGVETYYTNTFSSLHARTHDPDNPLQTVSFAHVDIREKVRESHRFAASVQHSLYGALAVTTDGIRDRGVKEASYVVLTGTSMPAVLAEVSFVSSPADEQKLQSSTYRQQIAEALYKGIAHYAASFPKVKIAANTTKPAGQY